MTHACVSHLTVAALSLGVASLAVETDVILVEFMALVSFATAVTQAWRFRR